MGSDTRTRKALVEVCATAGSTKLSTPQLRSDQRNQEAIRKKKAPPLYTKLGGLIYIHGHGSGSDWTWGLVALEENNEMKELCTTP